MCTCLPFPSDIIACLKTDPEQAARQAGRHQASERASEREAESNLIANYLPALPGCTERLEDAQVFLHISLIFSYKSYRNFLNASFSLDVYISLYHKLFIS